MNRTVRTGAGARIPSKSHLCLLCLELLLLDLGGELLGSLGSHRGASVAAEGERSREGERWRRLAKTLGLIIVGGSM
jgi:hypothetical protein